MKGTSRRVVVVKSPDPRIFDEAIFVVREDAFSGGVTNDEILKEARNIAERYIGSGKMKKINRKPHPIFCALTGAGMTAAVWILTEFL